MLYAIEYYEERDTDTRVSGGWAVLHLSVCVLHIKLMFAPIYIPQPVSLPMPPISY